MMELTKLESSVLLNGLIYWISHYWFGDGRIIVFSPSSAYRACAHLQGPEASFDRLRSVVQPKVPKAWALFPEPLQVDLVSGGMTKGLFQICISRG